MLLAPRGGGQGCCYRFSTAHGSPQPTGVAPNGRSVETETACFLFSPFVSATYAYALPDSQPQIPMNPKGKPRVAETRAPEFQRKEDRARKGWEWGMCGAEQIWC